MNIKYFVLSAFLAATFWGQSQAQSLDDAVTFSKEENPGTARIRAMGNVQTAVGGDISSISGNPAGLGFYSQSDISGTFNLLDNKNKTNYFGTNNSSSKTTFSLDQAGAVFSFPTYSRSGWFNFNMGISYNRTQGFNNNLIYEGINNSSTIVNTLTDIMADDLAFGKDFYQSGMVEIFANPNDGYFPLALEKENKDQYNEVFTRGNKNKTVLAFGSNYNNRLYIGASFGISSFQYEKNSTFIENGWTKTGDEIKVDNPNSPFADPNNPDSDFSDASYELFDTFNQVSSGTGLDLKIGFIYKPLTDWNIGVTINTPTWMSIQDDTRAYTDIDYYDNATAKNPFATYESDSYESELDYNLSTPWKFSVGATKFFSRGLISADLEYVTYNTIRYSSANNLSNSLFANYNQDIKDNLQSVLNVRVGGEVLFTPLVSGRAGFNYFGNPYKGTSTSNYSGSLGLGFKLTHSLYLDIASVYQVYEYKSSPYTIQNFWIDRGLSNPVASIKNERISGVLTLGAKF